MIPKVRLVLTLIAVLLVVLGSLYALRKSYRAGWDARERQAVIEMLDITRANMEAIRGASDALDEDMVQLGFGIESVEQKFKELEDYANLPPSDGTGSVCGLSVDQLQYLEAIR